MPAIFGPWRRPPSFWPWQIRFRKLCWVCLVVGTGRSDFANQVNNVLAFPGVFRGALNSGAERITDAMKIAAAQALAACVESPTSDRIIPDPLDRTVALKVAAAVCRTANSETMTAGSPATTGATRT